MKEQMTLGKKKKKEIKERNSCEFISSTRIFLYLFSGVRGKENRKNVGKKKKNNTKE